MRRAKWCYPLAALLSVLLIAGCDDGKSAAVLKMAHGLDVHHPVHAAMVHMAERLAVYSSGTMQIDIYPGAQLGDERELLELLQIGSLALTKVSASPLESFIPEFKIFSLPYVFRSEEHCWKVLLGDIGAELLVAGESKRFRGLGFYDSGSRSFYTRTGPISTPAALRGKKIRVQNSITTVEMVRALGAAATPIPWAEIYTALQQGVVDGAENNLPSYYISKHYEVAPFFSLNHHTYVPDVLLVSLPVWRSLTPQQQGWLQAAADDSVAFQRKAWQIATEEAMQQLTAAGVTFTEVDEAPFRATVEPMLRSYAETSVGPILRRIEEVR